MSLFLVHVIVLYKYLLFFFFGPFDYDIVNIKLKILFGECDRPIQMKMQQDKDKGKEDPRWKLLARKVASAKAMSSLTLPKRKRSDEETRIKMDHFKLR